MDIGSATTVKSLGGICGRVRRVGFDVIFHGMTGTGRVFAYSRMLRMWWQAP